MAATLPPPALQASKAALAAAVAENEKADASYEDGEVQEVEVNMETQADQIKTVFSDPTNFNVKVRALLPRVDSIILSFLQHPLFSPWTLWFDSPATKGRNLPQTPSLSAFPTTPHPATPGAAMGWMEDIKRVISFDSVEEFWGYVTD
jgi:translation initiation factor 4E